jgi:hypothetical protein
VLFAQDDKAGQVPRGLQLGPVHAERRERLSEVREARLPIDLSCRHRFAQRSRVVAALVEGVVAGATVERILVRPADQPVITVAAAYDVVAVLAEQDIGAFEPGDIVAIVELLLGLLEGQPVAGRIPHQAEARAVS